MRSVQKRSGAIEEFIPEKIRNSIRKAIIDSTTQNRFTMRNENRIVDTVLENTVESIGDKYEVPTSLIRDTVLRHLDRIDPSISNAFRKFDEKYKLINVANKGDLFERGDIYGDTLLL